MVEQLNTISGLWWDWSAAMFWQVGLLIILIACIDRLVRRWTWPQLRYALWSLILIKLILPPTLSLPSGVVPGLHLKIAPALRWLDSEKPAAGESRVLLSIDEEMLGAAATEYTASARPAVWGGIVTPEGLGDGLAPGGKGYRQASLEAAIREEPSARIAWQVYAMTIWLAAVLVLGIWLFLRLRSLAGHRACTAAAASLPPSFYNRMAACADRLGLRRVPRVVVTKGLSSPAVFGVARPVLLMPKGYLSKLSRRDVEHMLLHELAHIKRGDLVMHALYMLLQIVYWYNPLLWLVRRRLHHLRELSCDATVANLLREQTPAYRQTLLETARRLLASSAEPGLGLLGLFEDSNRLAVRLRWLTKPTWRYRTMKHVAVTTIAALMLACVLPMAQGRHETPVVVEKKTSEDAERDAELSRELADLKTKLEKLEVERLKLQEQLAALAQAREAATQAKTLAVKAGKEAEKARDDAFRARTKAAHARLGAHEHPQWAKEMQGWQEAMERWRDSDEFRQWEEDMRKWGQQYAQQYQELAKIHGDQHISMTVPPMPQMPPMPVMPSVPAPPAEAAVAVAPQPPIVKAPKVRVPKVVVPKTRVPATPPHAIQLPKPPAISGGADNLTEATVERDYIVQSPTPGMRLQLDNRIGAVSIRGGDREVCTVKAVITGRGKTEEAAREIVEKVLVEITPMDDVVRIRAKLPDGGSEKEDDGINVRFQVTVPRRADVKVAQKVGDVHVRDIEGDVKIAVEVGTIQAAHLRGNITLRTDVGNIDYVVPEDISAEVGAQTNVGAIRSDPPLKITSAAVVQGGHAEHALGSSATGVLGAGKGKINLQANVGSIRIRSEEMSESASTF